MKKILCILLLMLSILSFSQEKKQTIYNYNILVYVNSNGEASKAMQSHTRIFLYYNSDIELKIYIGNGASKFKIQSEFEKVTNDGTPYKGYMLIGEDGKIALFQVFNDNIARFILEDGTSYELVNET